MALEVVNDIDRQLKEAKINLLNPRLQKATNTFERFTWPRIMPALADYLQGMTVAEICRKHKLIDRNELYRFIKIAKLELHPIGKMRGLVNTYKVKNGRVCLPQHIIKCNCEACLWIKGRAQLINNNDLQ